MLNEKAKEQEGVLLVKSTAQGDMFVQVEEATNWFSPIGASKQLVLLNRIKRGVVCWIGSSLELFVCWSGVRLEPFLFVGLEWALSLCFQLDQDAFLEQVFRQSELSSKELFCFISLIKQGAIFLHQELFLASEQVRSCFLAWERVRSCFHAIRKIYVTQQWPCPGKRRLFMDQYVDTECICSSVWIISCDCCCLQSKEMMSINIVDISKRIYHLGFAH